MLNRLIAYTRIGGILLTLALFAALMPSAAAFTNNNGQPASLVLGQPDFTTNAVTTTASGMKNPSGVAIDPTSGKLFVADTGNNRVLRFASGTAFSNGVAAESVLGQADFTSNLAPSPPTASSMNSPVGVTVDSAGRLWVGDQINRRVLRFDGAASLLNGAAANGVLGQANFITANFTTSATKMTGPTGLAVDSAGRLWVADTYSSRVLRFDNAAGKANGAAADGVLGQPNFTSHFGTTDPSAITATGMYLPEGVAVDNGGHLWVADSFHERVLRFDGAASLPNGAAANGVLGQPDFTSIIVEEDSTASVIGEVLGVAIDNVGTLWVSDTDKDRVLRFDGAVAKANGAAADGVLGQVDFTSQNNDLSASGTHSMGLAVDGVDNLWVADYASNRVLRFEPPIIWASPAAIVYGTALSATQLNASIEALGTFSYTPAASTVLNVGTGQALLVTFSPTDPSHYAPTIKTETVLIDVTQAPQMITFGGLVPQIYGTVSFAVSGTGGASGQPVSFTSTTPSVCTVSGSTVTLLIAGSCTIAADQAGNANYSAAPQVAQSFSVTPAPLTITADDKTTFVGTANPALTASYAGFVNGDAASSLAPQVSLATTATTSSAVGDYPITASGAANPNYAITFVAGTLSVTAKQVPVITWANPSAITYGTALGATQLNASASVPGTLIYTPAAGTVLHAGNSQALAAVFSPTDTDTYANVTTNVSIDVLPAPLTITAANATKVYGASLPGFSASATGLVNGDTLASLATPLTLGTTASAASTVGSYTITPSAADANYVMTLVNGTLSVTPAPLIITANNKIKQAGTANPALTASYTGFVNGDAASSLAPAVNLTTTAVTGSAVDDYPITASGAANPNYAITFVAGTLSVTAKQVPVITWATPAAITYGTLLGATQLNASASVPGTLSYTPAAGSALNAGNSQSLAAVFTPTDGDTYAAIETSVSIDVLRASLTITADHKRKDLGAANPTLTASYSGFVHGDTRASLEASAVLATTAITTSPLGTYPITVSGAADANYAITFANGTLTITNRLIYLPNVRR